MRRITLCAAALLVVGLTTSGFADEPTPPAPAGEAAGPAEAKSRRGGKGGGEDFPPFEEVIKDMDKREGFLTLYLKEKEQKLYAVLPANLTKEPFLIATSMTYGPYAAFQWTDALLKLEILDKDVLFVQPNTFQVSKSDKALEDVVERTYPPQIIASTRILAMAPGGGYVIDLGELLRRSNDNLVGMRSGGGMITTVRKAKAFPQNNEIELVFRGGASSGGDMFGGMFGGGGGGADFGVHYSISALPKGDYKSRSADDRIGYFLTAQEDFSKTEKDQTRFHRYVNRWHLKKAEPSLKLSPPVEPIVFYVEKTVPVKYRRAVAEGILAWNKAFESLGFTDAVVVRQQTADNEFKDLDPEDVRYNFFRWITSGRSFAMGPSRTDPRTGQILDADIIMDEGMLRTWSEDFDFMVDRAFNANLSLDERRQLVTRPWEHPDWDRLQNLYARELIEKPNQRISMADFMMRHLDLGRMPHDHRLCEIGTEATQQIAFATMMMDVALFDVGDEPAPGDGGGTGGDAPKGDEEKDKEREEKKKKSEREKKREEMREELLFQMVKGVTMHEVGHTLGLRHNFKASSWKSLEEIQNCPPDQPFSGSVMDYLALNVPPDLEKAGPFDTLVIGPYDMWAIEYGYAIAGDGDRPRDEAEMLKAIAQRVAAEGLAYATDEDVSSPDPWVNRWDLGSDPLVFALDQLKHAQRIIDSILTRIVKDNDSYNRARIAFQTAFYEYSRASSIASKFIGGASFTRTHKGDPDAPPPIVVVDAATQRRALDLIEQHILGKDAIKIDPKLQQFMAASRWSHAGSSSWGESPMLYVQDMVMRLHRRVLYSLMGDSTIQNLYDAPYRVEPGTDLLTIPELFGRLTKTIFAELAAPGTGPFTVQKPMIEDIRRNLQREYVSRLIQIALRDETSTQPAVARSLALAELRGIRSAIATSVDGKGGADAYTAAHLEEMTGRIDKALNANMTIGGSSGGAGMLFSLFFGAPGSPQAGLYPTTPAGIQPPTYIQMER